MASSPRSSRATGSSCTRCGASRTAASPSRTTGCAWSPSSHRTASAGSSAAARRTSGGSRSTSAPARRPSRISTRASPRTWTEKLDLPAGKAFTGYSTALAVAQLRDELQKDARRELTFVAFTPKPRTVSLEISRQQGVHVRAAGRELAADLFTLHPKIPFPISLFAGARDARLWFTHAVPPALLRAEQNLVEKDDPVVVIDVIPRGAALPKPAARRSKPAR